VHRARSRKTKGSRMRNDNRGRELPPLEWRDPFLPDVLPEPDEEGWAMLDRIQQAGDYRTPDGRAKALAESVTA
jgi:hypothetical protein